MKYLVVAAACVVSLSAQQPPAFDVAAIKPAADTTAFSYSRVEAGGRYLGQNMSLRLLIKTAYGVHDNQIVDGPSWIDSDRWDINAKADGYKDAMAFRDVSRLMVRPLLADRFKLVMHHELRELPVYALVVAKPNGELGPKMRLDEACDPLGKPIAPAEGSPEPGGTMACGADGFNPRHLWARSMTLNYLLIGIRRTTIDRVVVDHTGLTGKYDWEVQWVPEDLRIGAAKPPEGPSIFQAFRDQLGLKLEATRDRVDVLVIDHAEHPETD
ncbi:MAG TPA: TIGR03435 family protein [Vicinamibacterales bacterium]|nr:TIGR03435 family protein [Vicinamibacterales bacterium]